MKKYYPLVLWNPVSVFVLLLPICTSNQNHQENTASFTGIQNKRPPFHYDYRVNQQYFLKDSLRIRAGILSSDGEIYYLAAKYKT
ncbi:MAG: hypothetical protein DWB48_06640 [Nitrosomonas sp.]|nr:hypothetical protein [Nitrosomonas sp.]